MEASVGEDWISKLPDCILQSLLLALPLKEAGATTILSKRWRHIFHSIPGLVFEDESFSDQRCWIDAVLSILRSRRDPIDSCLISISFLHQYEDEFDTIIRALCDIRVRELILLNLHNLYFYRIPAHLLSCMSLCSLQLDRCRLSVPLGFAGLPNLRNLWLYDVIITDDQIEQLVSCCHALQLLKLSYCTEMDSLVIRAPSLSMLEVSSRRPICFSLEKAPVLSEVTLHFGYLPEHYNNHLAEEEESEVSRLVGLLESLAHVEVLSLVFQLQYTKYLERDRRMIPKTLAPGHHFIHLKKLFIKMDFNNNQLVSVLSCILYSNTCLEELVIRVDWLEGYAEMEELGYWDYKIPQQCFAKWPTTTTLRLKLVYQKYWIGFVKHILMNAPALKKMSIVQLAYEELTAFDEVRRELLILSKASSDVVVELIPLSLDMHLW